jgi:hypothetical protein
MRYGACTLPGVSIKYDTFVPAMWSAVDRGFVAREHAEFVGNGLRYGFMAGVEVSKLFGHRWFKNYPTALSPTGMDAVSRATMKRVQSGKTLDLGRWSSVSAAALKHVFSATAIFPMGCVPKPLEPTEMRPTDDHTRTGLNAATDLSFLRHTLNTYNEVAWFLKQDYFMRVSDVDAAFPMLPFHPDVWPFMLFRFPTRGVGQGENLFMHLCGDFGTSGMPGCFKIFFVDVVVNMARSAMVLTLPMPVYVDDMGLIGPVADAVDAEMTAFHAWAMEVCGVMFKVIKDRLASQCQLMLGFWWDSRTLTRTLEERKLLSYVEMLADLAARSSLSLRDMQSVAGRMQRAIMTFPPGAACLIVGLFTLMAGLKLPWHRRRLNKQTRTDMLCVRDLLRLNLGRGFYSFANFRRAPVVASDASKQQRYTGGGYVSQCGMYNFWVYGTRAARQGIDYLEGDTVVQTCKELAFGWHSKMVPFKIDNMVFERSAAKGRSSVERLNVLIRELFALQLEYQFVIEPEWISSEANVEADHLSRGREQEFLAVVRDSGFWSPEVVPIRHGHAGAVRNLPERRGEPAGGGDVPGAVTRLRQLGVGYSSNVSRDGAASLLIPEDDAHPVLELKPAYRDGKHIGDGLFVPLNFHIGEGTEVAAFVRGACMRPKEWYPYCSARGLDSTWSGFAVDRTWNKTIVTVFLYDPTWVSEATRPIWSYLNHAPAAPTCWAAKPVAPGDNVVRFRAVRDLEAGEELTFAYGGNTADWDGTERSSNIAQEHVVASRTRSGGARGGAFRPFLAAALLLGCAWGDALPGPGGAGSSPPCAEPSMSALRQTGDRYSSNVSKDGAPFNLSVPYSRASLYEGLSVENTRRLEQIMDNRFAESSWRTIRRGVALWRAVADAEGWSPVIYSDDPTRGGKLVTWVLDMVDDSKLTYKSIESYVWGARVWQTLQHQADPVYGLMHWDSFMESVKVLTWSQSEPRRQTPLHVVEHILDAADWDDFEDVQFVNLMLDLMYTFSRAECPLPKSRSGRGAFAPDVHWRVGDFDVRLVDLCRFLAVRFQVIKQDARVERPEAAGNGDWAYLGEIPDSKWCPIRWAMRLQQLHGARRDREAPYFVNPRDRSQAYLYSTALEHFHKRQRSVGVVESELSGFHGLRVLGYNQTKHALGEDMAVAHGLWKSNAHRRYDRFALSRVARIPAAVAGLDEADAAVPEDFERMAQSPAERLVRGRRALPSVEEEDEPVESAVQVEQPFPDSGQGVDVLPPGWVQSRRSAPSGRQYLVFHGPNGSKARSRREVWRIAERGEAGPVAVGAEASPFAEASTEESGDVFEEDSALGEGSAEALGVEASDGTTGVASPVVAAVVGRVRPDSVGSLAHRFPDSMVDYLCYHERPSLRAPPRERSRT